MSSFLHFTVYPSPAHGALPPRVGVAVCGAAPQLRGPLSPRELEREIAYTPT